MFFAERNERGFSGADCGRSRGWCAADVSISASLGLVPSLPDPTGLSVLTLGIAIFGAADT